MSERESKELDSATVGPSSVTVNMDAGAVDAFFRNMGFNTSQMIRQVGANSRALVDMKALMREGADLAYKVIEWLDEASEIPGVPPEVSELADWAGQIQVGVMPRNKNKEALERVMGLIAVMAGALPEELREPMPGILEDPNLQAVAVPPHAARAVLAVIDFHRGWNRRSL